VKLIICVQQTPIEKRPIQLVSPHLPQFNTTGGRIVPTVVTTRGTTLSKTSCVTRGIFNLITVQQDASYSVYYISVGSSTCFVC